MINSLTIVLDQTLRRNRIGSLFYSIFSYYTTTPSAVRAYDFEPYEHEGIHIKVLITSWTKPYSTFPETNLKNVKNVIRIHETPQIRVPAYTG